MTTVEDLCQLLTNLGGNPCVMNDHEVRSTCVIHGGDNPEALSLTIKEDGTVVWQCFTKCRSGGTLIDLLIRARGFENTVETRRQASAWLKDHGYQFGSSNRKPRTYKIHEPMDRRLVDQYLGDSVPIKVFRTFRKSTLETFNVRAALRGPFAGRLIFPLHNELGQIVGFKSRTMSGEKKYRHTRGIETKYLIYNYHRINPRLPVFVVEGEFDVMNMVDKGYGNTVGLLGSKLPVEKETLFRRMSHVVLVLDPDEAGMDGASEIGKLPNVERSVLLPLGRDPGDLTADEIRRWIVLR